MSFTNRGHVSHKRYFSIAQRRKKVASLIQENPGWTQNDLAEALGVNKSTVCRDIKEINQELNLATQDVFMSNRKRVLHEIHTRKQACLDKLDELAAHPAKGSRWQEEWTKLVTLEIKIIGLGSPQHMIISQEEHLSKDENDAVVNAVLSQTFDTVDAKFTMIEPDEPKQIENIENIDDFENIEDMEVVNAK